MLGYNSSFYDGPCTLETPVTIPPEFDLQPGDEF